MDNVNAQRLAGLLPGQTTDGVKSVFPEGIPGVDFKASHLGRSFNMLLDVPGQGFRKVQENLPGPVRLMLSSNHQDDMLSHHQTSAIAVGFQPSFSPSQ